MPAGTEHGGITELDCDVEAEEVWEAMRTLKNGKAGCPTDGLVNELLKYGVAQGDTLSCILFDFYIDGLVQLVYVQCPGLPLQEQAKIAALLFADDFTGFATTPARLQQLIDVVFAYCRKWRLRANIESGKSTVMVFHPTGKDQHSPELPPVQDETEYRGQQASWAG